MSAAVIICAYTDERWDQLIAAVGSARDQTVPPRELVVVVDGNAALLERASGELPATQVVGNRHAPGISGARNTGVEVTTAPVVAFLDDDAVAEEQWLEALVSAY
jgi:glycosyltransferase involved in cell wall biosynthesis